VDTRTRPKPIFHASKTMRRCEMSALRKTQFTRDNVTSFIDGMEYAATICDMRKRGATSSDAIAIRKDAQTFRMQAEVNHCWNIPSPYPSRSPLMVYATTYKPSFMNRYGFALLCVLGIALTLGRMLAGV